MAVRPIALRVQIRPAERLRNTRRDDHQGEHLHATSVAPAALAADGKPRQEPAPRAGLPSASTVTTRLFDLWIAVALAACAARSPGPSVDRDRALFDRHAHRPPPAGLAYTHARVFDPETQTWLLDHTVIVRGDTIAAVGPSRTLPIPAGAELVDLAGKSLLPGLIDIHSHLNPASGVLHIASGVTTIRDLGNDEDYLDHLAARFAAGTAIGPHVIRFGRIEGRGPNAIAAKVTATTPAEAIAAVAGFAGRGYAGIKIYNSVDPALVPVIAREAHARGLPVTGHVPAFMRADQAVEAGFDGLEHINLVLLQFLATTDTDTSDTTRFTLVGERGATVDLASSRVRDFIALLRARRIVVTPTFAVMERLFTGVPGTIAPGQEPTVGRMPPALARMHTRHRITVAEADRPRYRAAWQRMRELAKLLYDEGVPIAVGSDSTAGLMLQRELEVFAEAGFPNATILALATLGNARALGREQSIGSIAVGKRADLVVLDGDPVADLTAIRRVVSTMRAGVVFPSAPLYQAAGVSN
jgi:imidazolonepropionase-like amidohydrolase